MFVIQTKGYFSNDFSYAIDKIMRMDIIFLKLLVKKIIIKYKLVVK
jgi:hypothetical protein